MEVAVVRSMTERAQRRWAAEPPGDVDGHGLFETARRLLHGHPVVVDASVAVIVLGISTAWLALSPFSRVGPAVVQTLLVAPLVGRRRWPATVFCLTGGVALVQWVLGYPLLGDLAVLIALYTVAVHQSRLRAAVAAALCECGAVMAAFRWDPAGTIPRSYLFLTATVVAALCTGLTVASGSRYLAWLDERARRLEVERDQQATIAANAERTRIARELHDIVSHSLSVVITLADAASLVSRMDPERAAEAMIEVSEVGRHALADMRTMLGVLRDDAPSPDLVPQPGTGQLALLVERVRSTGLDVDLDTEGSVFPIPAALELTVFRLVQEALTNTLRHAHATHARVTIRYDAPIVAVHVTDDGNSVERTPSDPASPACPGRGIEGMRERVALHGGMLSVGRLPGGGWSVSATLHAEMPARAQVTA
jgi:signal transduction histidine kinase